MDPEMTKENLSGSHNVYAPSIRQAGRRLHHRLPRAFLFHER
jgi:hypothetical protein